MRDVQVYALDRMPLDHEYHPGKWCLHGEDLVKGVQRTFDLDNILSVIEVL